MNLAHLLARSARVYPDRPAVALGDRPLLDYRGLARRCASLATAMRSTLRLKPGDRAWLVLPERIEPVIVTARRRLRLVVARADQVAEGLEVRRTRVLVVPGPD